MKQVINSHESTNFQQGQSTRPLSMVKVRNTSDKEDVWLTPKEFREEVCRLLKAKFDEYAECKIQ